MGDLTQLIHHLRHQVLLETRIHLAPIRHVHLCVYTIRGHIAVIIIAESGVCDLVGFIIGKVLFIGNDGIIKPNRSLTGGNNVELDIFCPNRKLVGSWAFSAEIQAVCGPEHIRALSYDSLCEPALVLLSVTVCKQGI